MVLDRQDHRESDWVKRAADVSHSSQSVEQLEALYHSLRSLPRVFLYATHDVDELDLTGERVAVEYVRHTVRPIPAVNCTS